MSIPILSTKLYAPPPLSKGVDRPRLIEVLNTGLHRKLTLISAPAGFGKTTLISAWVASCERRVAWLSLDAEDSDPTRFLTYLIAALQTINVKFGGELLGILQSPQPPPTRSILTTVMNAISATSENFILILDDYHVIDSDSVDDALFFLLDHLPPQMHLVITTREDPRLPLARLRARGHLTELRGTDLRFTTSETALFLNQVRGLGLSAENIAALDTRTEGWIAGLQLAATSMQGHQDPTRFIDLFTGSHHFVLDYLMEEVLHQQHEAVQAFLLHTSMLDRLCGSLCDSVLLAATGTSQETLAWLERANLFIVPLDNERRWYRYHHLFADLLRQRFRQGTNSAAQDERMRVDKLHLRASQWYEANGLDIEAFHHAAAAQDVERAAHLMDGQGMPLHFRGGALPVMNWLGSLSATVLERHPALMMTYALVLTMTGKPLKDVEQKLQTAEAALQNSDPDTKTQDLLGQIAATRAMLAIRQLQSEVMRTQSQRALSYLRADNLPVRTVATWTMGFAHQLQGDRVAAMLAYTEAIAISRASGNIMITLAALTCMGQVQETENQLHLAAQSYSSILQLVGEPAWAAACEACLGLARIFYEWNDLDAAQHYGELSRHLAQQIDTIDTSAASEVMLARIKLARGDVADAATLLAQTHAFASQNNFAQQMPDIAATQIRTLLQQGKLEAATALALTYDLPLSQARILIAQREVSAALALLEPMHQRAETKGAVDEQLKIRVLYALAHHVSGEQSQALQSLEEALTLAEPSGFIRIFIDEGAPMVQLLSEASRREMMPIYINILLNAFAAEHDSSKKPIPSRTAPVQSLHELLSERELEVLQLIAQGFSNQEISEQLFVALSTVKGHNQKIFDKLQVQRRTEAVALARKLGIL